MERCGWCGSPLDMSGTIWFFGTRFIACSEPCGQKIESYLIKMETQESAGLSQGG